MKKSLLVLSFFLLSMTAWATKIYINPGHGSWSANCRHMGLINVPVGAADANGYYSGNDTLGFFESNTNLWKGLFLEKKLLEKGYQVKMSRRYSGGTNELESSAYDKALHVIGAESQAYGSDYFISIHSNAHIDGYTTNYPVFIHKGYDNSETNAGSIWGEKILWDHHFKIFSSGMEPYSYYSATNKCIRGGLSMNGWDYGVLRTQDRPGTLVEGYFHTYQPARHRAMNTDWCRQEGLRYFRGFTEMYGTAKDTKGYIMGYVRTKDKQINQTDYTGRAGNDIYYPLNGAKIVLRDANGKIIKTDNYKYVARDVNNQNKSYYTTDNYYNGVFVFDDLTPGTYTISVHCAGYADVKQTLTVTAHETTYTQVFMTAGSGTEPDVNEIQGTSGLNPYAYDLSSSWNESTQKLTVKFSLNADAYVDGAGGYADGVQIYVSDDKANPKKYYVYGLSKNECKQGQNKSFTIDLSSGVDKNGKELPKGKPLYASVTVQGDRSNTAPREYGVAHRVKYPNGIAVDKNPDSKNFGKIFVNEAYQYAQGGELTEYFTKGLAGMYVLDADFQIRNTTRYTGGYDFSWWVIDNTYSGLARKGYQPWCVRVSEEGRIFVCSNDMHQRQTTLNANGERDGVAVWEVDRNNFNNWTPILHGYRRFVSGSTGTNYTFSYKDVNGVEQFIGPICGMDVKGTGDDVTLLLYTVNQAGIWLDMNGFRAYEYNVKSGALKPVPAFNNGGYGLVFEYTSLRYGMDGSYWFGGSRADGSDGVEGNGKTKEPNLGHVKLDGTTADYTNYNSEFYGGAGMVIYKSTYNNSACNAANHTWLVSGKDNGGSSDGLFDVFIVNSTDGGGAGVTRMDGNSGRPNWQNIYVSGMGRNLNDMAVDYAENLYIVGSTGGMVRAFAMPYCGEKTTTVRDEFTFSFPLPPVVKDSIAWHPYPIGYKVSNMDLWEQFAEDAEGQALVELLTGEQSAWKWLGDYIKTVDATVEEPTAWEQAVNDFFKAENAFATAGQPASWEALWWNATFPDTLENGATMPIVKRHGWALENWRYGNHDGYYYFGEVVKDNKYDETHKDSIDLWVRWVEKCFYEGYEPYIQSGDTSAIDLRTWTLTANEDLLALIGGKTTDIAIKRTLQKDVYNSLYLPFDISKEQLAMWVDADGKPAFDTMPIVYVYETDTVALVGEKQELQLLFHELADDEIIKAGVPFLIKPTEDVAEKLYIQSAYISTGETAEVADGKVSWIGEWQPESVNVSEDYHVLLVAGNDTLQTLAETTTVLALTAYVKVPASVTYDYAVIKLPSEEQPEETKPTIVWHPYPAGYTVTNDDLWERFVEDTVGQTLVEMMTNEQSAWKWLGDYILAVDTTVEETTWEQALADFFTTENAFATAGQPTSWDSLWWNATFPDTLAHGDLMPKVKRSGWIQEDWRYGNELGYYYFSEDSKVVNNQYDESKKDSTHLWARWIEKCMYEGYMTYVESEDTSAIDLKEYAINANADLLAMTNRKYMSVDVYRTLVPNQYNVLCLPITIPADKSALLYQITDEEGKYVFDPEKGGAEPTILVYEGYSVVVTSDGDVQLQLNFHPQREMEDLLANVPFIIVPGNTVPQRLSLPAAYITDSIPTMGTLDDVEFVGTLAPTSVEPSEEYKVVVFGEANQLITLNENHVVLGLGGYFRVPTTIGTFDYATIHVVGKETTALERVYENTWVTKVIRNQRVLILRGNDVYNTVGQEVK